MDFDDDLIKLLTELAFFAGGCGMVAQSDAIATGLEVMRPGSEGPHLVRAISRLNQNNAELAERILREQALKAQPDSSMAKAFLGVALHMQGRLNERDNTLKEVIAINDDEDAVRIAHDLLGSPAPA